MTEPVKRLLSAKPSEIQSYNGPQLKQAIASSDGRIIMGETVVTAAPLIDGVTNAEMMAAFGADLLLLNELDVFDPQIVGFDEADPINTLKKLTGRPIGINLEPVDQAQEVQDERVVISAGRGVSPESCRRAQELGVDFILLTGNPATGVSNDAIHQAIPIAREHFDGLVFAGKMHSAGLGESVMDAHTLKGFIKQGADGVLIPAVGTVPGMNETVAWKATAQVQALGGLVISAIGTSQESADAAVIRELALSNKRVGCDIHHLGDGSFGRMPDPENLMTLSNTIRGRRHTYYRMGMSINR